MGQRGRARWHLFVRVSASKWVRCSLLGFIPFYYPYTGRHLSLRPAHFILLQNAHLRYVIRNYVEYLLLYFVSQ